MRRFLKPFALLALSLTLAFASVGATTARHSAQGATSMVICTGYGLVRITLDAEGNPVEQTLPCPDCMLAKAAFLPDFALLPVLQIAESSPLALAAGRVQPRAAGQWHQSRAPPLLG